jgi:hypothetical protein
VGYFLVAATAANPGNRREKVPNLGDEANVGFLRLKIRFGDAACQPTQQRGA